MSNRMTGSGIKSGSTSVSVDIVLRSSTDSTEVSGKVAADMDLQYFRQGASASVDVTSSNLATLATAWTAGGVKEIDATSMKGTYRTDWPDAAFVAGADWVEINVTVAGCFVSKERFVLSDKTANDLYADIAAVKSDTTAIAVVTAGIQAAQTTGVVAASPTPTATQFGLSVNSGESQVANDFATAYMVFTSSTGLKYFRRAVISNTGGTAPVFTISSLPTPLPAAPAAGDTVILIGAGGS